MKQRTPKQAALDVIRGLPDDATYEQVLYEVYFRQKIDHGLKQADEGDLVPAREVMKEARAWLKSTSHPMPEKTSTR